MSAKTFPRFLELSRELQDLIWHHATEKAKCYRAFFIGLQFFSNGQQLSDFLPFPIKANRKAWRSSMSMRVYYHKALINCGLFVVQRAPASSREAFYEWWREKLETVHDPDSDTEHSVKKDVLYVLEKLIQKLQAKRESQA